MLVGLDGHEGLLLVSGHEEGLLLVGLEPLVVLRVHSLVILVTRALHIHVIVHVHVDVIKNLLHLVARWLQVLGLHLNAFNVFWLLLLVCNWGIVQQAPG